MTDLPSPIIIGCTGGSGSRLLQHIFSEAGYFMGNNLNGARDAMDFDSFLNENINKILVETHSVNYDLRRDLPEIYMPLLERLRGIIEAHKKIIPETSMHWGWKSPRNIFILPFIKEVCPDVRFIHLVRDGRDMALSENQNQPRKYYADYFGVTVPEVDPVCAIKLWERVNLDAVDWATSELKSGYHRLRFEDLCTNPETIISDLAHFLGRKWDISILAALVKTPETMGRYKKLPVTQCQELEAAANHGLHYFGYL